MQHIVPVISQAIHQAGIELNQLSGVAFTQSPGLIGALLVGTGFAKSLALSLNLPLIPVHHMQAHVLSNLIEKEDMPFPFLCLTVSGGHTQIVVCRSPLDMHVIGETLDDAAGEAFDKSAKLLGLPYPGGPLIDQYAQEGDPLRFHFPEPQMEGLDFSFSGVKTSILYFLQKMTKEHPSFVQDNLADLCASIQHCIVGILMKKVKRASLETGIRTICMAGGVSANKGLRKALVENGQKYHWEVHIPSFAYCTDNAAMIALTGYHKFLAGERAPLSITASARATW
jgi:N6-L-threonylcarbamoyladenine synthase